MPSTTLEPQFDHARELREISEDFLNPLEVIREGLANAYDAGAHEVEVRAVREQDETGRIVLSLHMTDDGLGMDRDLLRAFFGLGVSKKPELVDRPSIGFKGHGTKLYYRAKELWVATRQRGGELVVAHVPQARSSIRKQQIPEIMVWTGDEASAKAIDGGVQEPGQQGTSVALVDFTADSTNLVDVFIQRNLENYLRLFTVHGSFQHIVEGNPQPRPALSVRLQGSDKRASSPVAFGHPWPKDRTALNELRREDERRPYNYFVKTFATADRKVRGGASIDVAVAFEGKRGRIDRDACIHRQGSTRWYAEEERYGLWLCRDHIPVEMRTDWLRSEELPDLVDIEPKRALVLVNCQEFMLTANRGSVGNSQHSLLDAVRDSVVEYLQELTNDKAVVRFLEEYQEERYARARDKDGKALRRRIDRFNSRKLCRIVDKDGRELEFFEPLREIALYGLLCQLEQWEPDLLPLDILDYDDHWGIDLLVRKGPDPSDLLSRDQVRYTELKYRLEPRLNHAFKWLHSVVCWESTVAKGDKVTDATNVGFTVDEYEDSVGVTHTSLSPLPNDKHHTHTVRVIVLRRLLEETRGLTTRDNPRRIDGRGH